MLTGLKKWLEVRIGLQELIRNQLTEYRVPRNINLFYTLGFVALTLFVLQVVTGILLLIFYVPEPARAFKSVQRIMTTIPYGWLFRLMHVVGSNLLVAVVMVHMLSVFFMNSYKKPRELTWITGALLILITMTFCLSGYLLPWSQLSYWATTIATAIPTAFPYVGGFISDLLRGGATVSGGTLGRFFALHVGFLPAALLVVLSLHLFLIRRIGVSAPPFGAAEEDKEDWTEFHHDSHPRGEPFFPHYVLKETVMVMVCLAVMFFIITFIPTLFLPEDTNLPANPFKTPEHIKPEWYFLAPYQMLKLIPNKFVGISLQLIIVGLFLVWPLLDTTKQDNILKRPALLVVFGAAISLWIGLTIWGKYS
jgi:ubiquinol-cytochrome c reductase cytochrome b subunit